MNRFSVEHWQRRSEDDAAEMLILPWEVSLRLDLRMCPRGSSPWTPGGNSYFFWRVMVPTSVV